MWGTDFFGLGQLRVSLTRRVGFCRVRLTVTRQKSWVGMRIMKDKFFESLQNSFIPHAV